MGKQYLIYILLILILGISVFSAYKVISHYDLYANDPLVYGAKNYNINYCTCSTNDGIMITFDQEKVTQKIIGDKGIPSKNPLSLGG